jgi:hypothetical protein
LSLYQNLIWAYFLLRKKLRLCGAPRSRAPAPPHGHLRWPRAVAAPHPSNPLRASTHPFGVSVFINVHRLRHMAMQIAP